MRIIIPNDVYDDEHFAEWLVRELRQEIILSYDEKQLEAIGEHIEEKLDIKVDIFDVLIKILNSMRTLKGNRVIQIVIQNRTLYKDSRLTTQSMAKLIDIGNIDIKGTYIFSTVFNRVRSNLSEYRTKYTFENGGI